jgi:hypothetical protein
MFYLEMLADLAKAPRAGRTDEAEVRVIARKFSGMSGTPVDNYREMAIYDLWEDTLRPGRIPGRR